MLILVPVQSCNMSHITYEQRYTIQVMLAKGISQNEIGLTIGKHKSVISREISRNKDGRSGLYTADLAQRKTDKRKVDKPKAIQFTQSMQQQVEELLRKGYSPEQVVGRMKKQGIQCVSHERLYQHIWQDKRSGGQLYEHLRRRGRKYRKRGKSLAGRGCIPNRVDIDLRPKIVEARKRFGDLEIDTIVGKNHKGALVTSNDRVSGMVKIKKVNSKTASEVRQAAEEILQDWKPYIHTITADNGKEFAEHEQISESLNIDFYFAKPYHSWQRGSNENLNGLIRQYFPKRTDFSTISDEQVKQVENILNNRPRKRLNFETPLEKMENILFHNQVAFVT